MPSAADLPRHEPSDAELIRRTRDGDTEAYGVLFSRHAAAATALAARLTSGTTVSADDVVSDAFVGVLTAIRSGRGPEEAFRAYLYTAVRNGAAALRARAARTIGVDDPAEYETPEETPDPVVAAFESQLVQRAFTSLPERWQAVLWYSEVEAMKPAAIAPLLGVSPNGVSALLVRAREGLRDAYVAAHVEATDDARPECRWTAERLGGHARGTLSARDRRKVLAHLDDCSDCRIMALEAAEVTRGLHLVVAPLVLGGAGTAWLATRAAEAGAASVPTAAGGALAAPRVRASKVTPARVAAASAAAAVTAAMVALAVGGVLGGEPAPPTAAPESPAPEAVAEPPERPEETEPPEQPVEEEPAEEPAAADDAPAPPPRATQPPPAVGPPPPPAPDPGLPAPVPVTMTQTLILGRMSLIDAASPVLGPIGTVQQASVVWETDDPLLATLITFDLTAGQFSLPAHTVHMQNLPGGAVRYVATADATAIVAAFSTDTWSVDGSFGVLDWHIRVVEAGPDAGGVQLDGPLALAADQPVMVTLDAPGSGTAFVLTLDGTVVTSSVVDGVLVMEAPQATIVQQVTVLFDV